MEQAAPRGHELQESNRKAGCVTIIAVAVRERRRSFPVIFPRFFDLSEWSKINHLPQGQSIAGETLQKYKYPRFKSTEVAHSLRTSNARRGGLHFYTEHIIVR